jgi:serine/threonine protein kinase
MEKIGKYELVREIGRGATSTVYLGNDPFSKREVAVKIAFPDILRDPKRGRLYTHIFLNEAALIGKLSHPHIVQTYDAVVDDHLCYIVMEYVAGGTLEAACTANRLLSFERVVEIIFKCTRALDFAFRAGIIHRDIKPANILVAGFDPNVGRDQDLRFRRRDHRLARPHPDSRHGVASLHVAATGERSSRSITRPTSTLSAWSCTSC